MAKKQECVSEESLNFFEYIDENLLDEHFEQEITNETEEVSIFFSYILMLLLHVITDNIIIFVMLENLC